MANPICLGCSTTSGTSFDAEVQTVSSDFPEELPPSMADAVTHSDKVHKLLYSEHTQTMVEVRAVELQTELSKAERGVQVGDYVTHGPEPPPGGLFLRHHGCHGGASRCATDFDISADFN